MTTREVALSVPGKLILMGEHAVVQRRPGLVASIGKRVRLSMQSSPARRNEATVSLDLRDLDHHETLPWSEVLDYTGRVNERWRGWMEGGRATDFAAVIGDDPAHVVKVALGEVASWLGDSGPSADLRLRIDSELPLGGGMGSSAAVGVGVIAGYLALCGVTAKNEEIEALALQVERSQHGNPSGVDSCAVQRGGVLWAEYDAEGELELEPVDARAERLACFRVVDTGRPGESTGSVVAAVRSRIEAGGRAKQDLLDRMAGDTRGLRLAICDPSADGDAPIHPMRSYQQALDELGVVPAPVRALVRTVEAFGGAAKVSGAGSLAGPGAGALLVYHPQPEKLTSEALGSPLEEVGFGVEGVSIETSRSVSGGAA